MVLEVVEVVEDPEDEPEDEDEDEEGGRKWLPPLSDGAGGGGSDRDPEDEAAGMVLSVILPFLRPGSGQAPLAKGLRLFRFGKALEGGSANELFLSTSGGCVLATLELTAEDAILFTLRSSLRFACFCLSISSVLKVICALNSSVCFVNWTVCCCTSASRSARSSASESCASYMDSRRASSCSFSRPTSLTSDIVDDSRSRGLQY